MDQPSNWSNRLIRKVSLRCREEKAWVKTGNASDPTACAVETHTWDLAKVIKDRRELFPGQDTWQYEEQGLWSVHETILALPCRSADVAWILWSDGRPYGRGYWAPTWSAKKPGLPAWHSAKRGKSPSQACLWNRPVRVGEQVLL